VAQLGPRDWEVGWTEANGVDAPGRQARRASPAGGLRFRDLRHAYVTWLVDDGVPPNVVLRVMGHERSSTTLDLYTRRTDNADRILQAFDDPDDDPGEPGEAVPASA
jgi:integrase